jgi:hypothetical protein
MHESLSKRKTKEDEVFNMRDNEPVPNLRNNILKPGRRLTK